MSYVISFSGGLDSTTLLLHLLLKKRDIYAVTFDYGQKHKIEIQFAKKNIEYLKSNGITVNHRVIDVSDLVLLLDSSLTDKSIDIPEGHYMDNSMKSTFVPNRNAIFTSIIYGYAISIYKKTKRDVLISLGVHSGDHLIYPDCRPIFYENIMKSFKLGNWDSEHIDIYTPYMQYTKSEIIKDGLKSSKKLNLNFDMIYKNTLTTYFPDSKGKSNGRTGSDVERILAFNELGMKDPGLYTKSWESVLEYALNCDKS